MTFYIFTVLSVFSVFYFHVQNQNNLIDFEKKLSLEKTPFVPYFGLIEIFSKSLIYTRLGWSRALDLLRVTNSSVYKRVSIANL